MNKRLCFFFFFLFTVLLSGCTAVAPLVMRGASVGAAAYSMSDNNRSRNETVASAEGSSALPSCTKQQTTIAFSVPGGAAEGVAYGIPRGKVEEFLREEMERTGCARVVGIGEAGYSAKYVVNVKIDYNKNQAAYGVTSGLLVVVTGGIGGDRNAQTTFDSLSMTLNVYPMPRDYIPRQSISGSPVAVGAASAERKGKIIGTGENYEPALRKVVRESLAQVMQKFDVAGR